MCRRGPREGLDRLGLGIWEVIDEAIWAGGSTLRDLACADVELGYLSKTFSVYDREGLARDQRIHGPAIVEEWTTTTIVPPEMSCVVDRFGDLVLEARR